ncbi:MAG: hypothetical protein K2N06_04780 [Oscillospiraceae bacterium]|nr:hypothetical protein [Oscillospiraceae bacterium]
MEKFACLCCGCLTLDERGGYDICPVCFWEDDAFTAFGNDDFYVLGTGDETYETVNDEFLDLPSGANHGLTLRRGRENYRKFGACVEDMIPHVRKPKKSELPDNEKRRKK